MSRLWRNPAFLVVLAALGLAASGMAAGARYFELYFEKMEIYPQSGRLVSSIPGETSRWVAIGPDRREEADVEKVLGTTNYVSRLYRLKSSPESKPVVIDLHVAYYTGTIGSVPHVPDRCFVGGGMQRSDLISDLALPLDTSGWQPVTGVPGHLEGHLFSARTPDGYTAYPGRYVLLPRDPQGLRLRTMEFITPGSGARTYSGYFFIANGGWVSQAEEVRLLAFDLRTPYAYYVKVQFTSTTVESSEELAAHAASMLDELLPEIMHCTPDWLEVETGVYPPSAPRARTSTLSAPASQPRS